MKLPHSSLCALLLLASLPAAAAAPDTTSPAWSLSVNLAGFKRENAELLEEIFELLSKDGSPNSPAVLEKMRSLKVGSILIEGGLPTKKKGSQDFPDTALLLNLTTEIPGELPEKLSSHWSTLLGYPAGKVGNTPPELNVWMVQPSQNQILLSFPPTPSPGTSAAENPHSKISESLLGRVNQGHTVDPRSLFSFRINNPSSMTESAHSELLSSLKGPVEVRLLSPENDPTGIQFHGTVELPDAPAAKRSRRILDGIAATAAASAPKPLGAALDEKLDIQVEDKTIRIQAAFSSQEMVSWAKHALESQKRLLQRRLEKSAGSLTPPSAPPSKASQPTPASPGEPAPAGNVVAPPAERN
jgi:hypothetical protein